ncbi:uncharacterized protein [Haliaeetus albicilla]|uniref:uncharacterized protein n=2 Tax=Haliaeetus albicilla TaxID=8969 RepID=UPI0037E7F812
METQQNASSDNKMKALLVFRNVMGHMKRKEASPTALQLVDNLPPLFDDPSPCAKHLQAKSRSQICEASPGCTAREDQTISPSAVAIPGELCTGAAGVAGGECRGLAQALPDGNLLHAWPFVGLGPFSHGCRSGPQLLCVEPDSKASPLTSATLTPWLRERPLLKSSCPPPYQQSSQLRELSICLFKDAMQTVVGNDKQQMRKNVRRSLLPLFFHMSDQTESVAKASREALLVAAKLLKWKRLKHLTRTQQTGRIGECLLVQDRSRVEEYLSQSLPYLKDAQVTLREAALKFIGLAARHLGDESEEKLSEICNALQLLEKDAELSVSSLAAQTMLTLRSPREQPTSGWTLWALCCWPCKAGQK